MMVRVHKPRRDDSAAEIHGLLGVGTTAGSDVFHEAVLDEQPVAVVIRRCDVRVDEEDAHRPLFCR